jgi:hypothetical protein
MWRYSTQAVGQLIRCPNSRRKALIRLLNVNDDDDDDDDAS